MRSVTGPDELPADVAGLWDSFSSDLEALGGGSDADLILLGSTLRSLSRYWEVTVELDAAESLVVKGSMDQLRVHPLIDKERNLWREVADGFDRLSLSFASRDELVKVVNRRLALKKRRVLTKEEADTVMTEAILGATYE